MQADEIAEIEVVAPATKKIVKVNEIAQAIVDTSADYLYSLTLFAMTNPVLLAPMAVILAVSLTTQLCEALMYQ